VTIKHIFRLYLAREGVNILQKIQGCCRLIEACYWLVAVCVAIYNYCNITQTCPTFYMHC